MSAARPPRSSSVMLCSAVTSRCWAAGQSSATSPVATRPAQHRALRAGRSSGHAAWSVEASCAGQAPAKGARHTSRSMWLGGLDDWLADPAVRTHHARSAAATPDALWRGAESVRLTDTRVLGRVVRWRLPGTSVDAHFNDLFRSYPFVVLDEGDHHLVQGLAGRIWTAASRDYPRIGSPDEYAAWDDADAAPRSAR